MLEALERLLLNVFQSQEESSETLSDETQNLIRQLSEKPASEKFTSVTTREDFRTLYNSYNTFKNSIRNGNLGKQPNSGLDTWI